MGLGDASERLRTIWKPEMDRYFIDLMLEQVAQGRKFEDHLFSKRAWKHMSTKFNFQYEKDVLKNRHKTLRNLYRGLKNLLAQPGFSWNEKRSMVIAGNHVWDQYLKEMLHQRSHLIQANMEQSYPFYPRICEDADELLCDVRMDEDCGISTMENETDDCEQRASKETASSSGTRTQTYWRPPMDRYFINLMLAHVHQGNQFDGVFSKQAWVEMISSFHEKFGFEYSLEILKNRYKTLRRQYNLIKSLLQLDGFAWDETRQMVIADDCVWQDYIKDLRSVIHEQGVQALLQSAIEWKVGCGDEVRFWEDCWLTDQESLRAKYPRLYQISCQQQQVIQDMRGHSENDWEWKLEWRRHLFDNEVQAAVSFLEDISRGHFDTRTSDCWVWKLEPSGQYSTRSAYRMLLEGATDQTVDEALQDLWQLNIPLKATIFAWRLIKDRIPTKGNLRRRQVQLNDSLCPFCSRQEEEASHLFFNCPRVLPLWWESLSWTKTVGAFSLIPRQNYMQHTLILKGKIPQSRWKCWWVALTWSIWQHRNRIVFLNETFNGPKLMEDAIFLVWSWLRQLEKGFAQPYNFWSRPYGSASLAGFYLVFAVPLTKCPQTSKTGQSPITPNSNEEQFSSVNELANIGQKQKRQLEKGSNSTSPKKSRNDEQGMAVALHEMAAVVSTVSAKNNDTSISIENVIEAVQALHAMDDDLVLDACDFLEDERNAKTFLALDAKLRKKWLIRKLCTQV
ncbi:L10-interacting MYB domain-containing protein [Glycine soja]